MRKKRNTYTGLNENIEALLCYIVGWIGGVLFILKERENKFVRFHAMQSIIVFGSITAVSIVVGIPIIGPAISDQDGLVGIALWFIMQIHVVGFIFWIILIINAYRGVKFKLRWIGNLAEKCAI
jgi:uncharacterized membrane protein